MAPTSVLPASTEAAVLAQTLRTCGDLLDPATVALALLHGGVLHFVSEPLRLDDRGWQAVVEAIAPSGPPPPPVPSTHVALPLLVHRRPVGVLVAQRPDRPFDVAESALLRLVAERVAAAVENGRLHASLAELLAEYMSPDVASTLLADPDGHQLGGGTRDVTVLFADLKGFTAFSERSEPAAVVALLNRYYAAAVPAIVEHGGTVSAFIGDAIMGLFGAPLSQPEHPLLAARAALALQEATSAIADERPDLPRFRVGINTGPATVGNVGSPRRRVFTAIGDTVNLASRLEALAPPGGIVIGAETHAVIRSFAEVRALEEIEVKGKSRPVRAYELLRLRTGSDRLLGSQTVTIRVGPGGGVEGTG